MSILKKKHLLEKWMCPYKNNRKELQNQVFHLEIQRCCHQLVQELTKFPVLKCIFLLGKSRCSHTSKIIRCKKSDNWNYYFNQFLGQQNYSPFGKKKNTFDGEYPPITASGTDQKVEKCFLKLFLILRYLNFSPAVFGHVGKQLDRKANINFKIDDVTELEQHLK